MCLSRVSTVIIIMVEAFPQSHLTLHRARVAFSSEHERPSGVRNDCGQRRERGGGRAHDGRAGRGRDEQGVSPGDISSARQIGLRGRHSRRRWRLADEGGLHTSSSTKEGE